MKNVFLIFPAICVAIVVTGCLISEIDEYKIVLNDDNNSGTITTIKYNIQSNQLDAVKQQEDFDELISNWKDDQYLLEKVKEGIYVKERDLKIVNGKLQWKEVALFSDFRNLFCDLIKNDILCIGFGNDETVTATNGELIRTKDSTYVKWQLPTKELILKIQKNNFTATSNFVEKFKAYTKSTKIKIKK